MYKFKNGEYIKIETIDEICNNFKNLYQDQNERIEYLLEENKKLRSENYKDEELQRMQQELEEARTKLHLGFPITIEENTAAASWQQQHIKKYHNGNSYAGVIGGMFDFCFIPTSIGTIGICECSSCRSKALKEFYSTLLNNEKESSLIDEVKLKEKIYKKYDVNFTFAELE